MLLPLVVVAALALVVAVAALESRLLLAHQVLTWDAPVVVVALLGWVLLPCSLDCQLPAGLRVPLEEEVAAAAGDAASPWP